MGSSVITVQTESYELREGGLAKYKEEGPICNAYRQPSSFLFPESIDLGSLISNSLSFLSPSLSLSSSCQRNLARTLRHCNSTRGMFASAPMTGVLLVFAAISRTAAIDYNITAEHLLWEWQ